jgi:beta-glucanase (GH16 family)
MADGETTQPTDVFVDDFSAEELDRDIWNVSTTGHVVNDELQAYVDSPETVYLAAHPDASPSGSKVLVLHPRHRPGFVSADGQHFDFVSGRIDTRERVHFTYGVAAARMKLPVGAGLWPAFWMMGYGAWPGIGEIDIMECVGDPNWTSAGVHGPGYSGEGGLVNKRFFPPGDDVSRWHVYAVERRPDEIVFTVDGATVERVTRPMTEFFGSWEFDDDKFLILNVALGGTYPFKTNGIRTPYHGLDADTVDVIAGGGGAVLVDWVRVTGDSAPA